MSAVIRLHIGIRLSMLYDGCRYGVLCWWIERRLFDSSGKLAASVTGQSIRPGDGCRQTCHRKLERMPEPERELKCLKYSVVVAGRFSTKRPPVQSPEGRPAAKKQDLV